MKLPSEIRERFVRYGRQGGRARAAQMSSEARLATARRAATSRWLRERFGGASFAALGMPGGELVDAGLRDLAGGVVSPGSLAVSLAAPRLKREGVPIGVVQSDAENRLYALLEGAKGASGELAHARYLAHLEQMASFADACRLVRRQRPTDAR